MQMEIRKCRPLMHMCANWSSALEFRMTSSSRIRISRFPPLLCKVSCCCSSLSISASSQSEKKNRSSQWACSKDWRTGLHDAEPTRHRTRSNFDDMRLRRSATAVDFPWRLPPTSPKTNGILWTSRSGSHEGSIAIDCTFVIFRPSATDGPHHTTAPGDSQPRPWALDVLENITLGGNL